MAGTAARPTVQFELAVSVPGLRNLAIKPRHYRADKSVGEELSYRLPRTHVGRVNRSRDIDLGRDLLGRMVFQQFRRAAHRQLVCLVENWFSCVPLRGVNLDVG